MIEIKITENIALEAFAKLAALAFYCDDNAEVRKAADRILKEDREKSDAENPRKTQPEKSAEKNAEPTADPVENTPTLEDVRAVLAAKSRQGHTAGVKKLLSKYGATKLTDIAPENYAALLAEVEALG